MKLRFEPPLQSDEARLQLTQGGSTAEWPAPFTPPSGSATILAHRTPLKTAPERVFFEAAPGGSFTTLGPTNTPFDPQKHDLVYIWDFGDEGATYDAAEKTLDEWRDANVAYGPYVAHVYETPGTYIIKVTVIEPDTGVMAEATFEVEVIDPAVTFPATDTLYVSKDGNFTSAPAGAMLFDDLTAALEATKQSATPKRVMLRRGEVWDWDHYWHNWWSSHIHLVSEAGPGARPILRDIATRTRDPLFTHRNTPEEAEFLYQGIAFIGGWDSTTETGYPNNSAFLIESGARGHIVIHDCYISGMAGSISEQNTANMPLDEHASKTLIVSNTEMTNWRGIGHFGVGASQYAIIGCKFTCDPNALAGGDKDGFHNEHGCIRFQPKFAHKVFIDGCDFFNRVGWVQNVDGLRTQQPCIRWNQNSVEGALLNMQRTSLEGGYSLITLTGVNENTIEGIQNILIERCVLVGTHMTRSMIGLDTTGVTIRNCLAIFPDVPRTHPIFESMAFIEMTGTYNTDALGAPVRIYNNTILNLMSDENSPRGDGSVEVAINEINPNELRVENNILHQPNIGMPQVSADPLGEDLMWTAREIGYISEDVTALQSQFATPLDTVRLPRPLSGSAALGGALSEPVSYRDFFGNERPEPPSIGAFEKD